MILNSSVEASINPMWNSASTMVWANEQQAVGYEGESRAYLKRRVKCGWR